MHNIRYYSFADDTHVYITLKSCDKWDNIQSSIEAYIKDMNIWPDCNILKLNKYKTEFTVFSFKQHVKKMRIFALR